MKVNRVVFISALSQYAGFARVVDDQVLSSDRTKRSTDLKDVEKRSIDGLKRKMILKDVHLRKK